jgi:sporulation protein YlmC with PRC-barrel domain
MHTRLSTALGMPVVDDGEDLLGSLAGILLHPDTAAVEGFFVRRTGFFESETLFLSTSGIEHWGSRIRVRSADALSPLDELVRVSRLQEEGRPILNQAIVTDTGRKLGRCADIQFDTRTLRLEWLFPRRFLRWGVPVPVSAILQVTPENVLVRGDAKAEVREQAVPAMAAIETLTSTPAARTVTK